MSTAKRIGRPFKTPPTADAPPTKAGKRKRPQLGIIVTQETRNRVEQMARTSGRSMGQEVEMMIERALIYDDLLAALRIVGDRLIRLSPHDDL